MANQRPPRVPTGADRHRRSRGGADRRQPRGELWRRPWELWVASPEDAHFPTTPWRSSRKERSRIRRRVRLLAKRSQRSTTAAVVTRRSKIDPE